MAFSVKVVLKTPRFRTRGIFCVGILPNEGNEAVFSFLLIGLVAFEVLFEKGFFVFDAIGDKEGVDEANQQGDRGVKDDGRKEEENNGDGIHRMADDAIGAGINYGLVFDDLDGVGEVAVGVHDFGVGEEGDRKKYGGGKVSPSGEAVPVGMIVDAGKGKAGEKHQGAKADENALALELFFDLEAAFKELGAFDE